MAAPLPVKLVLVTLCLVGAYAASDEFPGLHEWSSNTLKPSLGSLEPNTWVLLELYSHWWVTRRRRTLPGVPECMWR